MWFKYVCANWVECAEHSYILMCNMHVCIFQKQKKDTINIFHSVTICALKTCTPCINRSVVRLEFSQVILSDVAFFSPLDALPDCRRAILPLKCLPEPDWPVARNYPKTIQMFRFICLYVLSKSDYYAKISLSVFSSVYFFYSFVSAKNKMWYASVHIDSCDAEILC